MTTMTFSADRFDRDTGAARQAARSGPVIITEDGRPAQVLLSIADYRRLTSAGPTIAQLLAVPDSDDLDFDPPRLDDLGFRPAEFD